MNMQLLEIGLETEQLSACQISLLLGVFTSDNRIDRFLKTACKMLDAQNGFLAFHNEPYIWYSSSDCFKA